MVGTRITTGSVFEEQAGYARAVVLPDPGGDWVMVSGTTGYDYATGAISPDVADQARQCFKTIAWALGEAGASLDDLIRVRVILTDPADFAAAAPVIAGHCRAARPANTTIIAGLVAPEMKIEIEVTARKAP
ncbi:MAG: RidA family protein [Alphaproteobacteria bacterium]